MQEQQKKALSVFDKIRDPSLDVVQTYAEVADQWDEMVGVYSDFQIEILLGLVTQALGSSIDYSSLKVFEIGLGTGRVGKYLTEKGFTNLVGIEPCEALVKHALAKKYYQDIRILYAGKKELPEEWKGVFDLTIAVGIFIPTHVPPEGMDEMIESLKSGGLAAFLVRKDEWETAGYKDHADTLEKNGKWKKRAETQDPPEKLPKYGKVYVELVYEKL